MADLAWDTLIRNALVFDGSGRAPQQLDIAVKGGRIAARGSALPVAEATERAREVLPTPGGPNNKIFLTFGLGVS